MTRVDIVTDTGAVLVLRLHGRVRSPVDGHHRQAVVFVGPMVPDGRVASALREVADELRPIAEEGE